MVIVLTRHDNLLAVEDEGEEEVRDKSLVSWLWCVAELQSTEIRKLVAASRQGKVG